VRRRDARRGGAFYYDTEHPTLYLETLPSNRGRNTCATRRLTQADREVEERLHRLRRSSQSEAFHYARTKGRT